MFRGEDKAVALKIKDSVTLAYQSIDAMADLVAVLYSPENPTTALASYRKVATTGYTTLLRVSATEYTAIVPYTITDDFPISELMIHVMRVDTDARFPDGKARTKGDGNIEEVKPSIITT
jgi:hypothetical protein